MVALVLFSSTDRELPENFYKVDEGIYRSSQPSNDEMQALSDMGINVILNLRNYHDNIKKLRNSDIVQIHLPMRALDIRHKDVVRALKILGKAERPILVHCLRGADRTGCVIACYRMVYQDWPKEKAIAEFRDPKFGYKEAAFPGILEFLIQLDVAALKNDVNSTQLRH